MASQQMQEAKPNDVDLKQQKRFTDEKLTAMATMDGLQSMLVAQMLSVHQLQQKSMTYAHAIGDFRLQKYYTNSAVKLSNCFVQQANILARLQGCR